MIQPKVLLVVVLLISAPLAGCVEESQTGSPSASPPTNSETALSPPDGSDTRTATVTRVIDGDTMEVEFENGEEASVFG